MSIDTLLEAARYLEWQAQQQQITRGEFNIRPLQPDPDHGSSFIEPYPVTILLGLRLQPTRL